MNTKSSLAMHKTFDLQDIQTIAQDILSFPNLHKVIAFYAEMGTGKTTLIKALTQALGVQDPSSSPTFSIVNEYHTNTNDVVYHFDLYRINHEEEAYDMGIEEYLYSNYWCFIEWPEKLPQLLPPQHSSIYLTTNADGTRNLVLKNE